MLAPMAVDAVLKITNPTKDTNVDLNDIRIIKKLGETVEDSQLVDGIVFTQKSQGVGGPNKMEKAKIGLIQFCISPPKTDVSPVNLFFLISASCCSCKRIGHSKCSGSYQFVSSKFLLVGCLVE